MVEWPVGPSLHLTTPPFTSQIAVYNSSQLHVVTWPWEMLVYIDSGHLVKIYLCSFGEIVSHTRVRLSCLEAWLLDLDFRLVLWFALKGRQMFDLYRKSSHSGAMMCMWSSQLLLSGSSSPMRHCLWKPVGSLSPGCVT